MYGKRKGAAYGLAGLVKGLGILYLKQLNIMSTLQKAIQDKKNYRHREGKANHCNTCKCTALFSLSKSLCNYHVSRKLVSLSERVDILFQDQ